MKDQKHRYFVCYQAFNHILKTANSEIVLDNPIRGSADIEIIINKLKEINPNSQITILNYQKFEDY